MNGLKSRLLAGFANRVIVLLLLVILTFALPRMMPGGPLELLLAPDAAGNLTDAQQQQLRQTMGLTGSWLDQFMAYGSQLLHGDLGYSFHHAAPVAGLLGTALPWTGLLIALALPIYLLVGVGAGIEAGRAPHSRRDRILTVLMSVLSSIPPFASAIFLLLAFGILLPILPTGGAEPIFPKAESLARGLDILHHAMLPAVALAMHEIVRFYFIARGEAVAMSSRAFIVNGLARGIHGWRERLNYYGRNMLPSLLARMSDSLSGLVGAVLFVELTFSYPGVGHLIYGAILDRDYALLQGAVLGLSVLVLSLNWLIDAAIVVLAERG